MSATSTVVSRPSEHGTNHIVPVRVYVGVFLTLLVMTAITTLVSGIDLGPWNTVVALGIAVFKATLVVLFFMNVKYGSPADAGRDRRRNFLAPDHDRADLLGLRDARLAVRFPTLIAS